MNRQIDLSEIITAEFLTTLRNSFTRDWNGIHGFFHWVRVRENGLYLAKMNGAKTSVIEYFAFFHDNQRLNDGDDPEHGKRASILINNFYKPLPGLSPQDMELLCEACEHHTSGFTQADITIQTCWDADRLDLMRIGIMPNTKYLCTSEAKLPNTIQWAVNRSMEH